MSKKFFAALAMASAFMLTGAMVAEAADVTFGGQLRTRGEAWTGFDTSDGFANDNWNSFVGQRVRLNTKVKVDDNLSAFIQLQSATRWGLDPVGALVAAPREGHAGLSDPSDNSTDVGIHQAYFVQKNLFGLPVDVKAGRQEIVLDGHRLFGHTGWTTGAQAHDAIKISHSHDNMTVAFFFIKQTELAGRVDGGDFGIGALSPDDSFDNDFYVLYGNMKGLVGAKSSTSVYLVLADIDGIAIFASTQSQDFYTFGVRQAGSAGGIDYRVEAYFQSGKSGVVDPTSATFETGDKGGYLIAARVGKKFGNVTMKPKFTLWADYLSGTDLSDGLTGDVNSFNTLFDTGHKFYGFMDFFLGVQDAGLIDLAGKLAISPMAKTTVKLDYHHFQRAEEAAVGGNKTLGQEVDLTIIYKYSANMKMVAGYSRFFARDKFADGGAGFTAGDVYDDAQWAYLMLDMKF